MCRSFPGRLGFGVEDWFAVVERQAEPSTGTGGCELSLYPADTPTSGLGHWPSEKTERGTKWCQLEAMETGSW